MVLAFLWCGVDTSLEVGNTITKVLEMVIGQLEEK